MAIEVRHRRGDKQTNDNFTGPGGEITVDIETWNLRLHDGETPGGNVIGGGLEFRDGDFTVKPSDRGKTHECASGTGVTITLPENSAEPIPVGASMGVIQADTNGIKVEGQTGVTIRTKNGNTRTGALWSGFTIYKRAENEWVLVGDLI